MIPSKHPKKCAKKCANTIPRDHPRDHPLNPPNKTTSNRCKVSVGQTVYKNLNLRSYKTTMLQNLDQHYRQDRYFTHYKRKILRNIESIYRECILHIYRVMDSSSYYNQLKYPYWTHLKTFTQTSSREPPTMTQPIPVENVFSFMIDRFSETNAPVLRQHMTLSKVFHEFLRTCDDHNKMVLVRTPLTRLDLLQLKLPKDHTFRTQWVEPMLAAKLTPSSLQWVDVQTRLQTLFDSLKKINTTNTLEYVVWALMYQLQLLVQDCERRLFTASHETHQHDKSDDAQNQDNVNGKHECTVGVVSKEKL